MSEKHNLTPEEIERNKTAKQKAEDISYTLNHSVICTFTDFIDPYVGNIVQKKLGNKSQLPNNYVSEFIDDFGAVPLTIAAQTLFPSVMYSLQKIVEPAFKGIFLNGAKRDAKDWAKNNGYTIDSEEYKEKVEKVYKYEIIHIPQAIVWTISAIGLNVFLQKSLGNKAPIHHILAGKIGGSLLTAIIVLSGRSIFPRKAKKIDSFTSEKILLPIEDRIYDLLNIKHNDNEYYITKNSHSWADRIKIDKKAKDTNMNI